MILSDFLSKQMIDKSNPHEIIPISFDMNAIQKIDTITYEMTAADI